MATFWRLLTHTLKWRWPLYLGLIGIEAIFGAVFLNIVLAFLIRDVVTASESGNFAFLQRGMLLAIVAFVFALPGAALTYYGSRKVWRDGEATLQTRLFSSVADAPLSSINTMTTADLQVRTGTDLDLAAGLITDRIRSLAFALIIGGVAAASVFALAPVLGIVLLCIGAVQIMVLQRLSNSLAKITLQIQESTRMLLQHVSEVVSGAAIIRNYGLIGIVGAQMQQTVQFWLHGKRQESEIDGVRLASDLLFDNGGALLILFVGSYLVEAKLIDNASLIAAMLLLGNASYLFTTLNGLLRDFQRASVGAQRVLAVMEMPQEQLVDRPPHPIARAATERPDAPAVVIENLRYTYPGARRPLIDGLSFTVACNRITVLTGTSGAGKTTLLYLLMGLYERDSGILSIFGQPVSSTSLFDIRSNIAFVAQDPPLLRGTVLDNIRLGHLSATREQIIEAAKLAQADGFVRELPLGYDQPVGEDGSQLSGGQRQMIAIARAIVKPAKLLLLDEATSGLDLETECQLKQSLRLLARERTILAVSHRTSFIDADDIVVNRDRLA